MTVFSEGRVHACVFTFVSPCLAPKKKCLRWSGHQDPRIPSLKVLEAPQPLLSDCPTCSLLCNPSMALPLMLPQDTAAVASHGPDPSSILPGSSVGEEPGPGFLEQVKLETHLPSGQEAAGAGESPLWAPRRQRRQAALAPIPR